MEPKLEFKLGYQYSVNELIDLGHQVIKDGTQIVTPWYAYYLLITRLEKSRASLKEKETMTMLATTLKLKYPTQIKNFLVNI